MKNIVKATALSLTLALVSGFSMANENIAYIKTEYLFQNHPDRNMVSEKLDAEFKAPAEKLKADKKVIDDKIAALEKEAPKLRAADIKKREDEINSLIKAHDSKVQELQSESNRRQNEESQKLLKGIQTAINDVAKNKGYTLVLDTNAVAYAANGKDITEEVLKLIPASQTDSSKAKAK